MSFFTLHYFIQLDKPRITKRGYCRHSHACQEYASQEVILGDCVPRPLVKQSRLFLFMDTSPALFGIQNGPLDWKTAKCPAYCQPLNPLRFAFLPTPNVMVEKRNLRNCYNGLESPKQLSHDI